MNVHAHAEDSMPYTNTIYTSMYVCNIALTQIQDYVNQESMWSSNGSTDQRKYLATSIVFAGSMRKSIYISTDFQISERLHRGTEFSHNYTIGYLIDYLMNYIIIT